MIGKFATPTGGKCAIDFERIEAITTDDDKPNCVNIITQNDVYKVIAEFDELFEQWLKFKRGSHA
jgi:hypothetical protein